MSKRFTDSEKFRDVWYRKLPPVLKCFWEYLLSECDSAGIIEIDFESASFHIGAEVTENDLNKYDGRVIKLFDGKFFIPKFIEFQQGTLNPQNNAHKPIIEKLSKYGYRLEQPFNEFISTLKDNNKGVVTPFEWCSEEVLTSPSNSNGNSKGNINLNTTTPREREKKFQKPSIEDVKAYCMERNNNVDAERFIDFYTSKGWKVGNQPMKDWRAAVRTWERSESPAPASRKTADDSTEWTWG